MTALGLIAAAVLPTSAWAAISVSGVSVSPKPGSPALIIKYRLNQQASSVTINISNGASISGPTAKGVNSVEYTPAGPGLTATITATAPAAVGAGGAVQLVPVIKPNLPAVAGNFSGLSFYTRPDSVRRDQLVVPSGMSVTSKRVQIFASDGEVVLDKDIADYGSGSYPFGVAVAQGDPQERVYIASRSTGYIQVFETTPTDLISSTPGLRITGTSNNFTALDVTPDTNTPGNQNDYNVWLGDNKNGRIRHHLVDFDTGVMTFKQADPGTVASSQTSGTAGTPTGNDDPLQVAVDPTNRVMFKVQTHDSGEGILTERDLANPSASANLNKWTSTDGGTTWTMDVNWSTTVVDAFEGIPESDHVSARGIALGKGFDASNLAASTVWISVYGPAVAPNPAVRKIYHVRADTGAIIPEDTIDLDLLEVTGIAVNNQYPRYLAVDRVGNLAVGLSSATTPIQALYLTVLAPNSAGPSSDTSQPFAVQSPFLVSPAPVTPNTVGNSGAATVTFSAEVYAPNGIVADNVQMKINLAPIGGPADLALTRGQVSADGTTATYTAVYQVTSSAPAGSFDLEIVTSRNSGADVKANVNLPIYSALVPAWTKPLDGAVNSSVATNGDVTYVGTSAGSVYAFDKDGAPVASFGGGSVNIGEPVRGQLTVANGLLYVTGTTKVVILNSGNGIVLGTSPAIPEPFVAVLPFDPFDPMMNERVIVGGADNKLRVLNATTGAQLAISPDLGAKINRVAVGPSRYFGNAGELGQIVVAGTESFTASVGGVDTEGGRIYMLDPRDLSHAFMDASMQPWIIVDPKGAVRSRAVFGLTSGNPEVNAFVIGGASGLWGVDADNAKLLGWTVDASSGSNGNPYATPSAVDANPSAGQIFPLGGFTAHFATVGGNLYGITVSNGTRLSWAGDPIGLTETGGFPAGAGVLAYQHENLGDSTNVDRRIFVGGDAENGKFYGLLRDEDGSSYVATPAKIAKFNSTDNVTFPGYEAASFATTPALANDHVMVGATTASNVGMLYAFPLMLKPLPYVASITPANGAFGVPSSTTATLVFSKDVDPVSVNSTSFAVFDTSGNNVFASPVQGADAKTFTLDLAGLAPNKTYVVIVKGVKDPGGRVVPTFSSAFYTGAAPNVPNDVNGDFVFNIEDVREALRIAGGLTAANANAISKGDKVAPMGEITIADALALRKLLP